VLLLMLLLLVLVLVQVRGPRGADPDPPGAGPLRGASLAETSSRKDVTEGSPGRKLPGRVAVTRTMTPCGNNQSRRSWRTTGGTMETVVEPGCCGS
jgi:hypothetical protein